MMICVKDVAPNVQMIGARSMFRMANTYVLGDRDIILIEPIVVDNREEGSAWVELFEYWSGLGRHVKAVVQTHLHSDHVCGGLAVAKHLNVPFLVPPKLGKSILDWQIISTPGHAEEHVCLWDGSTLVCGDMLSTDGSVFIPTVGGDFDEYRRQCAKLAKLDATTALPAHGDPIDNPLSAFITASERLS
jgi:endoribonuclease LACTB2